MEIQIIKDNTSQDELRKMARENFGDMVKAVVDVEKGLLAVGGVMHADAERVLLENGSKQENLWGINIYPDREVDLMIEYESLINIRPQTNKSMEVLDESVKKKIKEIVLKFL